MAQDQAPAARHTESQRSVESTLSAQGMSPDEIAAWWRGPFAQPGSLSRVVAWNDHPDLREEVRHQARTLRR